MKKIFLPKDVNDIINKLNDYGFEAYAVGGCIRDLIMGETPKDFDITTSALPWQVKEIFEKTIDTGLKHGTVTVLIKNIPYEITTYRIDGVYENHRRPKDVEFTSNLVEDLRRRDFTMNAMAYNEKDGLIDAFSGIEAIENKLIICVGDADKRFQEDALRMLRAIRFSAELDFEIEEETKRAILLNAPSIEKISGERIRIEMSNILTSDNPHYIEKMYTLGLMKHVIPEFIKNVGLEQSNNHHIYTVDQHIYKSLIYIEPTETLRWTMFLHDIGKGYCKTVDKNGIGHFYGHTAISVKIAKEVLKRLRFDNKTIEDILKLIEYHDYRFEPNIKAVRKAVSIIGKELFPLYIKVQEADIKSQNPIYIEKKLSVLKQIYLYYKEIINKKQCISLKELQIGGKELINIGIKQGKTIGIILNQLLELVIEEPEKNDKQLLLNKAIELKDQIK